MKAQLLYVEDDESLSFVTRDNLALQGYGITHFTNGKEALRNAQHNAFDLCILDVHLQLRQTSDSDDVWDVPRPIRDVVTNAVRRLEEALDLPAVIKAETTLARLVELLALEMRQTTLQIEPLAYGRLCALRGPIGCDPIAPIVREDD